MSIQLGISQKSYSRLENGQTRLYICRLQEIAKILNIGMLEIFLFDENKIFKGEPNLYNSGISISNFTNFRNSPL